MVPASAKIEAPPDLHRPNDVQSCMEELRSHQTTNQLAMDLMQCQAESMQREISEVKETSAAMRELFQRDVQAMQRLATECQERLSETGACVFVYIGHSFVRAREGVV